MPWFRFTEEPRVTLRFRDSVVELNFANLGGVDGWAWVAEKKQPPSQVVLVRCANMAGLSAALTSTGFNVEGGSPAERIMWAAVKQRHAEELPEDERWRSEIIQSRQRERTACDTRSVYTFVANLPKELRFRDGSCSFEFARGKLDKEWVFRARKTVPPTFCDLASSRYGRLALEAILKQGVCVRDGTAAARLLDHLVSEGYATKRPASRRDLG